LDQKRGHNSLRKGRKGSLPEVVKEEKKGRSIIHQRSCLAGRGKKIGSVWRRKKNGAQSKSGLAGGTGWSLGGEGPPWLKHF